MNPNVNDSCSNNLTLDVGSSIYDTSTVSNTYLSGGKFSWKGHRIQYEVIPSDDTLLLARCILCEKEKTLPEGLTERSIGQIDVFAAAQFDEECETKDDIIGYVDCDINVDTKTEGEPLTPDSVDYNYLNL